MTTKTKAEAASPSVRGWVFLVPLVILGLDQLLKSIMTGWLGPGNQFHRFDIAGDFAGFQYVENRGAAFGILPEQTELLTAIAIVIVVFAVGVMWKESRSNLLATLAIGMVVGGALGNIVDRVRLGYVVDFIAVGTFPKFNLADAMVTLGVVFLLGVSFWDERSPAKNTTEEGDDG